MAVENKKNQIQEIKASARGIRISPRKVRLVAAPLKSLPVYHAKDQLRFMVQKSSRPIVKLVESAVAAAKNNHDIEPERLYIKSLTVDGGAFVKRYKPRAQGRAFPIRRRTSHINLVLGVSEKPLTKKRTERLKKTKKTEQAPVPALDPKKLSQKAPDKVKGEKVQETPGDIEDKKSWFNFFRGRKKGVGGRSQEDVKGKKQQQTFDRRGNM